MEKGSGIEECQRPGRCEEKGVPALKGARVSERKEIRRGGFASEIYFPAGHELPWKREK